METVAAANSPRRACLKYSQLTSQIAAKEKAIIEREAVAKLEPMTKTAEGTEKTETGTTASAESNLNTAMKTEAGTANETGSDPAEKRAAILETHANMETTAVQKIEQKKVAAVKMAPKTEAFVKMDTKAETPAG